MTLRIAPSLALHRRRHFVVVHLIVWADPYIQPKHAVPSDKSTMPQDGTQMLLVLKSRPIPRLPLAACFVLETAKPGPFDIEIERQLLGIALEVPRPLSYSPIGMRRR